MANKKKLKWAGGIGGVVSIITPLAAMLIKEEKEIHKDESIINDLNTKIINQANHTHQITDDVRKTLTLIYRDLGEVKGKVSGLENAMNLLMRTTHGH